MYTANWLVFSIYSTWSEKTSISYMILVQMASKSKSGQQKVKFEQHVMFREAIKQNVPFGIKSKALTFTKIITLMKKQKKPQKYLLEMLNTQY